MPNTLVTICARKGSKGLPGKNTKPLHGKPLIMWTIEQSQAWNKLRSDIEPDWEKDYSQPNGDICVSTDSSEVVSLVSGLGMDIIERPGRLAEDNTAKLDVIRHALNIMQRRKQKKYEMVIDLDVTNPMRTPEMIREAVWEFQEKDAGVLVSATKARKKPIFQPNSGELRLL